MSILAPEIIIHNSLKSLLKLIRTDYTNSLFTGTAASGSAVINNGQLVDITIIQGGTNYPFSPIINITGDGTGASARAILTGGVVSSIEILDGGSGYTSATITFVADETKSILYRLLVGNNIQRYDLFTQAITLLINKSDDPRYLDVNLFFNAKRASIPTIHITLPSESERNNAIGVGEGFRDTIFEDSNSSYIKTFNRRFSTRYNIIITSDNTNEVILLYHLIRNLLISLNAHFNAAGLENPKLGGGDIQINADIIPTNVFVRAISMEFEYDVEAQDIIRGAINSLEIIGIIPTPIV